MYGSGILPAVGLDENRKFPDVLTVVYVHYTVTDFGRFFATLSFPDFAKFSATRGRKIATLHPSSVILPSFSMIFKSDLT